MGFCECTARKNSYEKLHHEGLQVRAEDLDGFADSCPSRRCWLGATVFALIGCLLVIVFRGWESQVGLKFGWVELKVDGIEENLLPDGKNAVVLVFGPVGIASPANHEKYVIDGFEIVDPSSGIHHIGLRRSRQLGSRHHRLGETTTTTPRWRGGHAPGEPIYVWSRSAEGNVFHTPNGTGFVFDDQEFLFVEVHVEGSMLTGKSRKRMNIQIKAHLKEYHNETLLGVMELAAYRFDPIPPRVKDHVICVECMVTKDVDVWAFRNHGHTAGRNFETSVFRNGKVVETFSRSVELPQIFETKQIGLKARDVLQLQCHYETINRSFPTKIGASPETREMCNQYLIYSPNMTIQPLENCKLCK